MYLKDLRAFHGRGAHLRTLMDGDSFKLSREEVAPISALDFALF
jgi:hypothetical protein